MAKVSKKSEKISAFGGIFFVLDKVEIGGRAEGQVIDFPTEILICPKQAQR